YVTNTGLMATYGGQFTLTLRRGDLLFFHIHSREIADHMGVYLGDGQFIESPRMGETIRVSRLAEPFWQDHFLGARWILTEETIL
ncbi:C40 family peptidase, partial [Shigella boydii]|uniref:C40 family peptidase n=1 Tax=Shigella boydii TaxID=621 RepID=UPI000EE088AC